MILCNEKKRDVSVLCHDFKKRKINIKIVTLIRFYSIDISKSQIRINHDRD